MFMVNRLGRAWSVTVLTGRAYLGSAPITRSVTKMRGFFHSTVRASTHRLWKVSGSIERLLGEVQSMCSSSSGYRTITVSFGERPVDSGGVHVERAPQGSTRASR